MSVELDLRGINTLTNLLERLPMGVAARDLARKIAVWTTAAHQDTNADRKRFVANLSDLDDNSLSDTFGYWNAELIRLYQLTGLLEGQRKTIEMMLKKERALARGRIRRQHENQAREQAAAEENPKPTKISKLTVAEINDLAEEDPKVIELVEVAALLDMVMASVAGYREGCLTATSSLSREVSFRQAQYQARLR